MNTGTPTTLNPESGLGPALPGPANITDRTLPNGMRALVRPNPVSPSVVVTGVLHAGALYEPAALPGLAGFMTALLERGTEDHTFAELSDELEAIGADISIDSGRHTTGFDVKCLTEDLGRVLALLADMLGRPAFPSEQVERVRGQILTGLKQRDNNTGHRAAMAFRNLAYGPDHPYGRDTDGSAESIRAIGRQDLVDFYAQTLRPAGGTVALVGAIDPAAAVELLSATVGQWLAEDGAGGRNGTGPVHRARPVVPMPALATGQQREHVPMPGKTQSDVLIGNPAIGRTHPDWTPTSVANTVLGVFGLMGRLGENVRDRLGLAYHVSSRLSGGLGPGPWYAAAGVNPASVEPAIAAILDEMRRLQDEPVSAAELADIQAYVTGSLPLRLETNEGVAQAMLDMALYDLGLDYLEHFAQRIAALTPEIVQKAAQTHLKPDVATIAVAGPVGK